ncbi:predicted protein [Lichtheimia corymbifera JMRC:FSU:9682]|uniref:Putative gamma-glutamylcyclotransferase n=1 Tax=Lichtheimia corymbifera JMRC:FSU:9682 TaxID=1263082 RepID=A0A068SIA8_9FUNG|nr:predicted protein [Lichtheimia corymbifera JMRC:FSU:9682]
MTAAAFFYGTLMSPVVRNRVLCGADASVDHHELKNSKIKPQHAVLKGRDYPAVVYTGDDKDEITGILVQGLHELDVKRLDAFEGPEYKRTPVQVAVILDDQDTQQELVDCDVYLWIGDKGILENHGWDLEDFVNGGKQKEWLQDRCEFFSVDDLDIHHNVV